MDMCQNFYFYCFLKKENNCKDLSVSQDLIEFAKIHMPKSLKYIYGILKKFKDLTKISNEWVQLKNLKNKYTKLTFFNI
jgi:hypothetical protein